jgi:Flp pilus assembly pilin Flp
MMTASSARHAPAERSTFRSVALPKEHGGWGLTLEPALLGLLVSPGVAGAFLGVAGLVAFLARTPLKFVLVDRRRGRWLDRTRVAAWLAAVEVAVLAGLIAGALLFARAGFWVPVVIAGPLISVQFWFEARSRGRRLVPELAGAIGVCSVAAMIVLADGGSDRLAAGVWLVLAARVTASIPHVRELIARLHGRPARATVTWAADVAALGGVAVAACLDHALVAGAVAVGIVVVLQRLIARGPVPRPAVIGTRQMVMGFGVVAATAIGVLVSTR